MSRISFCLKLITVINSRKQKKTKARGDLPEKVVKRLRTEQRIQKWQEWNKETIKQRSLRMQFDERNHKETERRVKIIKRLTIHQAWLILMRKRLIKTNWRILKRDNWAIKGNWKFQDLIYWNRSSFKMTSKQCDDQRKWNYKTQPWKLKHENQMFSVWIRLNISEECLHHAWKISFSDKRLI